MVGRAGGEGGRERMDSWEGGKEGGRVDRWVEGGSGWQGTGRTVSTGSTLSG